MPTYWGYYHGYTVIMGKTLIINSGYNGYSGDYYHL